MVGLISGWRRRISNLALRVLVAVLAANVVLPSHAAERWTAAGQIKYVYPFGDGNFVLILATDAPECPQAGPGKYMYVQVGANGMTAVGAKSMLATALGAHLAGRHVSLAFDDASGGCYVNRMLLY